MSIIAPTLTFVRFTLDSDDRERIVVAREEEGQRIEADITWEALHEAATQRDDRLRPVYRDLREAVREADRARTGPKPLPARESLPCRNEGNDPAARRQHERLVEAGDAHLKPATVRCLTVGDCFGTRAVAIDAATGRTVATGPAVGLGHEEGARRALTQPARLAGYRLVVD